MQHLHLYEIQFLQFGSSIVRVLLRPVNSHHPPPLPRFTRLDCSLVVHHSVSVIPTTMHASPLSTLAIRKQQKKLCHARSQLVKTKATQSGYGALSRQDKRRAEYQHDRVTQERSLQKDLRRAETMARRIAQVLNKLHKDMTKIKQHAASYTFTSTVGKDSDSTGLCESDLSTAIDTRQAWKEELKHMITMACHYVDAQYLGNYSILHSMPTPATSGDSCNTVSTSTCCPRVWREKFYYATPSGDCLSIPSTMGSHSGDSTQVQPSGDTGSASTSPAADEKQTTNSYYQSGVSNPDLGMREMCELLVDNVLETWEALIQFHWNEGTQTEEFSAAVTTDAGATNATQVAVLEAYLLQEVVLFSETMLTEMFQPFKDDPTAITDLQNHTYTLTIDVHAHVNSIDNVEDESDLPCIFTHLVKKMNDIRDAQLKNDSEQQRIQYVRETSECNEAFHQDAFDELTSVDMIEVDAKLRKTNEMCGDLEELYADQVSKQSLFGGAGLDGCCW